MTYEIKYRNKEEMKDSDFEWLGKIPDDWHILKNKHIFKHRKKTYNKNENTKVLSLTIKGVKIKEDLSFGKSTESYIGHQLVKKDELIFTPRDFDATPILSGISPANGCISNLYFVLRTNELTTEKYVNWYWWGLKYGYDYFKEFSFGIRSSFNQEQFGDIPFLYTKITEQKKISNFLDYKTSQFDTIIEKKEKLIEKLEEAKKSLISEVVTGKVKIVDGKLVKRDESEMKDSGVEWLGKIPKDWEVKKLKYISECYLVMLTKKQKKVKKK
jgi:type I restriction enzyme S subunit